MDGVAAFFLLVFSVYFVSAPHSYLKTMFENSSRVHGSLEFKVLDIVLVIEWASTL